MKPDDKQQPSLTAFFHIEDRLQEALRQSADCLGQYAPDALGSLFAGCRDEFRDATTIRLKREAIQTLRGAFTDLGYVNEQDLISDESVEMKRRRLSQLVYISGPVRHSAADRRSSIQTQSRLALRSVYALKSAGYVHSRYLTE